MEFLESFRLKIPMMDSNRVSELQDGGGLVLKSAGCGTRMRDGSSRQSSDGNAPPAILLHESAGDVLF